MIIRFKKKFTKQLAKQPIKVQKALYVRIELFEEDVFSPILNNHALQGELKGFYSINITGDVRAIYEIISDDIYLYALIGAHSQLYG